MLFLKRPRIRRFVYHPFYYKPQEEVEEEGPRIRFRRLTGTRAPAKRRSTLILLLALILIAYMLYYLDKMTETDKRSSFQNFQVEEIIVK